MVLISINLNYEFRLIVEQMLQAYWLTQLFHISDPSSHPKLHDSAPRQEGPWPISHNKKILGQIKKISPEQELH